MRGTGRYNLALGLLATAQGVGASLSGLAAGIVVDRLGYSAAFLGLGASAAVAFLALATGFPETAEAEDAGSEEAPPVTPAARSASASAPAPR
jgi:MFS family permease